MSAACAEQHIFQPSHQLSKKVPFKDFEIPPRKLLLYRNHIQENATVHLPYEISLHKYLPSNRNNHEGDDHDADPYATDHFRMYEFKVRRCSRSRSHDWTDCPFAHPGEKARRRDPCHYHYCSTVCSDFRRGGSCPRGNDCDFAHGVFECWLHPTRYRTEACKDGKNCKRKVCFFAHSSHELRLLPEASPKYRNSGSCSSSPMKRNNHGCLFSHSATSSPTSTLLGLSPTSSLENMNLCEFSSPMAGGSNLRTANIPWPDVSLNGEDQQQFPSGSGDYFCATSKGFSGDETLNENGVACDPDLDLGWVNELLM